MIIACVISGSNISTNIPIIGIANNITPTPNIIITYYHPEAMNIDYSDINIWHYGNSSEKSIIEKDGKILLTNDCHANITKFNKKDFLLNL